MTTLSIVIATRSRSSLEPLLTELVSQTKTEDEVIVVGDGPQHEARRFSESLKPKVRYLEYGPIRCWGHPQRDIGMRLASKDYIAFLNDDDMVMPTYVQDIKAGAEKYPERPLIFQMHIGPWAIWRSKAAVHGNISTQMFVLPNVKERLGTWGRSYQGDFLFLRSTLSTYPEGDQAVAWIPNVLVIQGHRWSQSSRPPLPGVRS